MIYDAAAGLPGVVVGGAVVGGGVGLRVRVGEFRTGVGVSERSDTVGLLCTGDVVGVLPALGVVPGDAGAICVIYRLSEGRAVRAVPHDGRGLGNSGGFQAIRSRDRSAGHHVS